jgi:hypothetical protein
MTIPKPQGDVDFEAALSKLLRELSDKVPKVGDKTIDEGMEKAFFVGISYGAHWGREYESKQSYEPKEPNDHE